MDPIRKPSESAAGIVANLVLLSGVQSTYEPVHYGEGCVPHPSED